MNDRFALAETLDLTPPVVAILDVGAMATGEDRYASLIEQQLAHVTGFEPDPASLASLRTRTGPFRYLPYVLGDGGPGVFHTTRYPGCSSLLEPDPDVIDLFATIGTEQGTGNFAVLNRQPVKTVRLDDVPELGKVDYAKLDVQGAELTVLRNGLRVLEDVLVLEVEVEFLPIYRGQPLFGDIQRFAHDQGLLIHKLVDVAGRPYRPAQLANPFVPVSQILWADAVFVRDPTHLERYADEQLLKAALVLNDVYRSFDLVYRMLAVHDARSGGRLAERYAAALRAHPSLQTLFLNVLDGPQG